MLLCRHRRLVSKSPTALRSQSGSCSHADTNVHAKIRMRHAAMPISTNGIVTLVAEYGFVRGPATDTCIVYIMSESIAVWAAWLDAKNTSEKGIQLCLQIVRDLLSMLAGKHLSHKGDHNRHSRVQEDVVDGFFAPAHRQALHPAGFACCTCICSATQLAACHKADCYRHSRVKLVLSLTAYSAPSTGPAEQSQQILQRYNMWHLCCNRWPTFGNTHLCTFISTWQSKTQQ